MTDRLWKSANLHVAKAAAEAAVAFSRVTGRPVEDERVRKLAEVSVEEFIQWSRTRSTK